MTEAPQKVEGTFRNWCLTLHLDGKTEEELKVRIEKYPDWVRYVRYGREICPTTQSVHFQAWVMCHEKVRWTQFQSWIGNRWRSPINGSLTENDEYCAKDGVYTDLGTAPMQGRRTDIIGTKRRLDRIQPGESLMDIADEEPHFETIIKYNKGFGEYISNKRFRAAQKDFTKPEVIYIYGPPESGKDFYVDTHYPNVYDCPLSRGGYVWKDRYNMDPVVVYRNMSPINIKENKYQLLKELDRRLIQVEVKGGFVPWKPKTILITTIAKPPEMARVFDCPHEFYRRVTKVLAWNARVKEFQEESVYKHQLTYSC